MLVDQQEMYKLIIFDWDGTLMDSEAKIVSCLQSAINSLKLEFRSDFLLKDVIGLGLTEAILKLYPGLNEQNIHLFIDEYREQFLEKNTTKSQLFDGVSEMLNDLKQQEFLLAIATGKGRNGLDRILDVTKLNKIFDCSRCADETLSKPNPLMLTEILNELNISAQQSIMIGDTVYDLEMANNIKMSTIAITHGVHSIDRLLTYQPRASVSNISELHHCLNNLNKLELISR
ncbi:Similar to phosphoglycolate phosphatase, clustered with ribosomal large subunit pseudouridine synthase C [hydrothermal vent metagenome]|uniref:Similar to phosphoglycolate phosphatase, clustered with ribosomal large subunit pseudouridine synthase C n=1 Tax=hydrothermal vent metagenome TaxID=652676 RepID=A0A3B0ZEM7_9ZZZZ